jgi:hypothetical protein
MNTEMIMTIEKTIEIAKIKSFLWKTGTAGLAIVAVGVTVVSKIRRGQMVSKRDLEEFKEILNTMKAGVSK